MPLTHHYEDLGQIALGASAEVRRVQLYGQIYALKRLHPHLRTSAEALLLFSDEAKLGEKLSHPNLAACLASGHDERGPYQLQRFVPGPSLARVLEVSPILPGHIAAALVYNLAVVLQYLAEVGDERGALGVIHRDINPSNLIVSVWGHAVLIDFGVALYRDSQSPHETVRGTTAYMSPEQARGGHLTHQSDLYTMGLLWLELLTGKRAFLGSEPQILLTVASGKQPSIPRELPSTTRELLSGLFAENPKQRPSAATVCAVLSAESASTQEVQSWLRALASAQ